MSDEIEGKVYDKGWDDGYEDGIAGYASDVSGASEPYTKGYLDGHKQGIFEWEGNTSSDMDIPSDMYDVAKLFKEYEARIATLEDQLAHPTYSHRNGETTPPEVDGRYWVEDEMLPDGFGRWDIHWVGGDEGRGTYSWVRYYGPIPQPQRGDQ